MDPMAWAVIVIFSVTGCFVAVTSYVSEHKRVYRRRLQLHLWINEGNIFDLEDDIANEPEGERRELLKRRLQSSEILHEQLTEELEKYTRKKK